MNAIANTLLQAEDKHQAAVAVQSLVVESAAVGRKPAKRKGKSKSENKSA